MNVAMLQVDAASARSDSVTILKEAALRCKSEGGDLLLTPELFLCGYEQLIDLKADVRRHDSIAPVNALSERVAAVCAIARSCSIAIVTGLAESANEESAADAAAPPKRVLYNTTILVDKSGAIAATYRKTHLYGPFERFVFAASANAPPIVQDAFGLGFNIGLLCCFDVEFPEMPRQLRLRGANFIVAPSAACDGMVHRYMVRVRGYENGCFFAYPNYLGAATLGTLPLPPQDGNAGHGEFQCHFVGGSCITAPDGSDCLRLPFISPRMLRDGTARPNESVFFHVPVHYPVWPRVGAEVGGGRVDTMSADLELASSLPWEGKLPAAAAGVSGARLGTGQLRSVKIVTSRAGVGFEAVLTPALSAQLAAAGFLASRRPAFYRALTDETTTEAAAAAAVGN